ncbi:hypothetical protein CDAR_366211 [Caerostris darwini]|uniref:Uncharacterized protein n=1 Tax=Caerostris darwini TaxID=1538125 RepID=A0AAV4MQQ4_9ARAC|nr:hypothetical protein CDAR_366211 [Caerostris darwini]
MKFIEICQSRKCWVNLWFRSIKNNPLNAYFCAAVVYRCRSLYPGYNDAVPLASDVPYSNGAVAPAAAVRDVTDSEYNVYSTGNGYNYGYNVDGHRFNNVAGSCKSTLRHKGPLVVSGRVYYDRPGYNYGYNVDDRRFNDVARGYKGALRPKGPIVVSDRVYYDRRK